MDNFTKQKKIFIYLLLRNVAISSGVALETPLVAVPGPLSVRTTGAALVAVVGPSPQFDSHGPYVKPVGPLIFPPSSFSGFLDAVLGFGIVVIIFLLFDLPA